MGYDHVTWDRAATTGRWSILIAAVLSAAANAAEQETGGPNDEDEVTARFAELDGDADGALSESEFTAGLENPHPAQRDFKLFDWNGDGALSVDEFRTVPSRAPQELRGPIPDPLRDLVDERLATLEPQWPVWDGDGNGVLSSAEFRDSELSSSVPGLEDSTIEDWDRDSDGDVSLEDCRILLEIAYGIRREQGEPMRRDSGLVANVHAFEHIDRNNDDGVTLEELEAFGFDGEAAKSRFDEQDVDEDGSMTFSEWIGAAYRFFDPVVMFVSVDSDLDGRVSADEFREGTDTWMQSVAQHVFPGFDDDGDGFLSLVEFRMTPLANHQQPWHSPRNDLDGDGRLSRSEFDWDRGLSCASLEFEFFHRLDGNGDAHLDLDEWFFHTSHLDPRREFIRRDSDADGFLSEEELALAAPGKEDEVLRDFRLFDRNQDSRLTDEEFFCLPSIFPVEVRGPMPDPLIELVDAELAKVEGNWSIYDTDGDGVLSRDEFQASRMVRGITGLELTTWDDWDRDGDGAVSLEDARTLLEIAYGARRPQGEPMRTASALVVNGHGFLHVDRDNDDAVTLEELVEFGFDGQAAESRFREQDADGDGRFTFEEWTSKAYRFLDPVNMYRQADADLDGRVSPAELLEGTSSWMLANARHVFPGFDQDGDGYLSLAEYQLTPLANHQLPWHSPRSDRDGDGRLNRTEFDWQAGLSCSALTAEFFKRLDVNNDEHLDVDEWHFHVDPAKAPLSVVFRLKDADGDGQLTFEEATSSIRPPQGDENDIGYQTRLAQSEEAFRIADRNTDRVLDQSEFSSETARAVVAPTGRTTTDNRISSTARASATGEDGPPAWRMWAIVALNVVLVGGVAIYLLKTR